MGDVGLQVVATQGIVDTITEGDPNMWVLGGIVVTGLLVMTVLFIREMNQG